MDHPLNRPKWSLILTQTVAAWLPIAAATTGLALLVYGAVQQDLRLSADDPQIELARATADRLNAGSPPAAVVPNEQLDLARSLLPYALVYDSTGHLLASAANLHGEAPNYPTGVFDRLRSSDENRVTWQPEPGVRSATVAVAWQGGYVVVGRSLLLTERRIDQIGRLITLGWLGTLAAVALATFLATITGSIARTPTPAHSQPQPRSGT